MKSVWLLKSDNDSNEAYGQVLKDNKYIYENIPTLEFEYINQTVLEDVLHKPSEHSGIIFTSVRGVQSLGNIYTNLPVSVHKEWSTKKIFVVGKTTRQAVREILTLESLGSEAGNAKQLTPIILEETKPFEKPLLLPCGNLKDDDLPNLLAKNDRDFRAITCYETRKHPELESTLSKLFSSHKPSFIVFFSPSGVQFTIPLLSKIGINLTGIKVIAIGPTTNAALVSNNVPVFGICPEPSPNGLIRVLNVI